jgi:hypothetical protein
MATVKGGKGLDQKLRELAKLVSKPATLRVGFFESATYPDGTPVAMIAAIQNYGAPRAGIPPRPFFSNMVRDKQGEWPGAISQLLRSNGMDAILTLQAMGNVIEGQLRQAIIDTNYPPLRPETIRRKGFSKPLIESSHMINSVSHEVVGD